MDLALDLGQAAIEGFHEGQKLWVAQPDGSQRRGIFVADAETPGWFGGSPAAYVVVPEDRSRSASLLCFR